MLKRQIEPERVKFKTGNILFTQISKQIDPVNDFTLFRNFHRTEKWKRVKEPAKIVKPEFEFHQILSILNNYPQLMRKAGLILDFTIPYSDSLPKTGGINLIPSSITFSESDTVISVPSTAYSITDNGFYTDDEDGTVFKRGFVTINTDEFAVVQVDADGAAIKAHNLIENKTRQIAHYFNNKTERISFKEVSLIDDIQPVEPPEDEGLPSIRSAGIAVTKSSMAEHMAGRIQSNLDLQHAIVELPLENKVMVPGLRLKLPDNKLHSSDVIQGYRMDIAYESDPEKWYSLHQRKDEYKWYDESSGEHPVTGIESDEGFIELGITEDPDDPNDVFVSDTIARWEGWSLTVGKPGLAINHAEENPVKPKDGVKRDFVHTDRALEKKKYAFDPDLQFRINANSKIVQGTLPKLRFGKDYRIRIRTVDLAGNSLPLNTPTTDTSLTIHKNFRYLRYEPAASPLVLVGNELKDGEFLERMVIRSNFDQNCSQYESYYALNGKKMDAFSQRFLLPPDNSQIMAETHGMIEKAFTGTPSAAKEIYDLIAGQEGSYDRQSAVVEKVFKPEEAVVIYLPDPVAAGVAFFVSDGCETTHTQDFFKPRLFGFFTSDELMPDKTNVDIPGDWYKAKNIRIRLDEGELNTSWNAKERILSVFLPKGFRTRIRFSTFWSEKDLRQFSAIWNMINAESPSNIAEIEKLMLAGRHWMISPSREFELVHATQQPVTEPVLKALIPQRDFNETSADINIRFQVHGESTDKVEIRAKWTEKLDDGISVDIKESPGTNSINDVTVFYHDDIVTRGTIPDLPKVEIKANPALLFQPHAGLAPRNRSEFRANPQPEATRINKHFEVQANAFEKLQTSSLAASKTLVNTLRFDIEASKFSFFRNINLRILPLSQSFGDTKHRWVDYCVSATSRYREYFAKILESNKTLSVSRSSNWIEHINILSTARPKPPEIDYVIPTFEWIKTQNETVIQHRRLGGGLRIYLKRPWFSSGDGELLAVVLPPVKKGTTAPKTMAMMAAKPGYTPYYTHWGLDPLHVSTQPDLVSPDPSDFRYGPSLVDNLQYPDPKLLRATVAAYPVQFDKEKQMWYCDLAVNPGNMYFPFIRLVLARYQPDSVRKGDDDVCLSPVVLADMMQLMPDRNTTITFKNDDSNSKFTITITGVIYNGLSSGSRVTDSVIRISFLNPRLAQPVYGLIDDQSTPKNLTDEAYEISVSPKDISNNTFTISHDFRLPGEYRKTPFEIVVREFEQIPAKTKDVDRSYNDMLERSPENEKLIYADVFKINSAQK